MEISRLFGLPAHPLVVHAVVVLVPLAAIGMLLIVFVPKSRSHLLWVTFAVAALALVMTPVATGSGEQLGEQLGRPAREKAALERHESLGDAMTGFSVALFVGAAGLAAEEIVRKRQEKDQPVPSWSVTKAAHLAIAGIAVATAVAATVQVAVVGHSGAKATWEEVATTQGG